jgi:hypothetical protein
LCDVRIIETKLVRYYQYEAKNIVKTGGEYLKFETQNIVISKKYFIAMG